MLSNVVIDLSAKPKCEIICPLDGCDNISKLSSIRQTNPFGQPKFNPFNFERHYAKHCVAAKRKPFDDLTNHSRKICATSGEPQLQQPSHVANIVNQVTQHQNELLGYQARIRNLEGENSGLQTERQQTSSYAKELEGKLTQLERQMLQYRDKIISLEGVNNGLQQQQQQTSSYAKEMEGKLTQFQNQTHQYQTKMRKLEDEVNSLQQQQLLQPAASVSSADIEQMKIELKKCQTKISDIDGKLIIELIELMDKLCNMNDRTDSEPTIDIDQLNNKLVQYQARIADLEGQQAQQATHVRKIANDLRGYMEKTRLLQQMNILLRHKVMDVRSTVRAIGRIKPSTEPGCFRWDRSEDGTIVNSKV